MKQTLTLRIEEKLINRAKSYAKKRGQSVSQIAASYFSLLDDKPGKETSELTPIVRSLKGLLKGAKVGRKDHQKYLEEKFL